MENVPLASAPCPSRPASQVDLPLGGLRRGGGGWLEVRGLGERNFLHGRVLAGLMATIGEGTVRGEQAEVGHFGAALFRQSGAAVPDLLLTPSVLVRHKSGEFEGVLGPAAGGGLAGHPAGVGVAELCALPGAGPSHGYIGQRPEICREQGTAVLPREPPRDAGMGGRDRTSPSYPHWQGAALPLSKRFSPNRGLQGLRSSPTITRSLFFPGISPHHRLWAHFPITMGSGPIFPLIVGSGPIIPLTVGSRPVFPLSAGRPF